MRESKTRTVRLETERLSLRRFREEDLEEVRDWEGAAAQGESEARCFLDFCFRQYERGSDGPWALFLKSTRKIVGNAGYIRIQHLCGEVNYYVAPPYRGQGLATEAVKAILDFGFRELGLLRIQARCGLDNPGSERVLQKAGMKFSGLLEPAAGAPQFPAEKLYAILKTDFGRAAEFPPA